LANVPAEVEAMVRFEVLSALGRWRSGPWTPAPGPVFLNVGGGLDQFPGFVTVDFFGTPGAFCADLRFPLQIPNASVDGIFTEHALEHFSYEQAENLLLECQRVMKPGATIRVVVPDIGLYAAAYAAKNQAWFSAWEREVLHPRGRTLATPAMAISFVTQEYGHRSTWDAATLFHFLRKAGFAEFQCQRFGEGRDPMLLRDKADADRVDTSVVVEAVKATDVRGGAHDKG
jgi:predicted SAM-dependent methyltransferase